MVTYGRPAVFGAPQLLAKAADTLPRSMTLKSSHLVYISSTFLTSGAPVVAILIRWIRDSFGGACAVTGRVKPAVTMAAEPANIARLNMWLPPWFGFPCRHLGATSSRLGYAMT